MGGCKKLAGLTHEFKKSEGLHFTALAKEHNSLISKCLKSVMFHSTGLETTPNNK
jgi:hypothetical protein